MTLALPLLGPLHAGTRLDLQGECNRCGLCCVRDHQGRRVVCEHLRAELPVRPLGHPASSRCAAYEHRRPGAPLPIRLRDGEGVTRLTGWCHKDAWQEDHTIAELGIGRGCSLTLPVAVGQLVDFTPAKGH